MFFYCQMVSKLFVIDNLFCCWSNRHQARIIFMRSSLHLSEVIICMQACWYPMWGDCESSFGCCYVMYYHGPWCTLPIICCAVWWFLMEKDPLFFWSISMLCSKLACHADKGFFFIRTYTCLKKKNCAVDSCGRLWLAWPVINTLKKKKFPPVSLVTFATWSIVVFPSPAGITKIARPAW